MNRYYEFIPNVALHLLRYLLCLLGCLLQHTVVQAYPSTGICGRRQFRLESRRDEQFLLVKVPCVRLSASAVGCAVQRPTGAAILVVQSIRQARSALIVDNQQRGPAGVY